MIETKNAALQVLKAEAMPSLASAAFIFAGAPEGTEIIHLTVRTQGITISWVGAGHMNELGVPGVNATTSIGQDFGPNTTTSPYVFAINYRDALKVSAIQQASTATGYITYLKRATS